MGGDREGGSRRTYNWYWLPSTTSWVHTEDGNEYKCMKQQMTSHVFLRVYAQFYRTRQRLKKGSTEKNKQEKVTQERALGKMKARHE